MTVAEDFTQKKHYNINKRLDYNAQNVHTDIRITRTSLLLYRTLWQPSRTSISQS